MILSDKIALVTGGSSGMGKAICVALAKAECNVVFTFQKNETGAQETLKEMGKGKGFKVDLHNEKELDEVFSYIKNEYGHLDILVNNAGINRPRDLFAMDVWKEVFQVDLFSAVYACGKSIDLMSKGGKILNITSIYGDGKTCFKGLPAYGAAKSALNHFTQTLAKNFAPNVLVNAIAPGYVQTPLWKDVSEEEFKTSGKEQLIERMIQPEEIADIAISVIKSDAMTGEIIRVDGGISLKTI